MNPTGAHIAAISHLRTETAQRTGCQDWDNGGIRAALMQTDGAPTDVMAAACLAAGDPSLTYPSARAFAMHWPKNGRGDRPLPRFTPCGEHPDQDAATCPNHGGDFDPREGMALVRAALDGAAKNRQPSPAENRARAQEAQS